MCRWSVLVKPVPVILRTFEWESNATLVANAVPVLYLWTPRVVLTSATTMSSIPPEQLENWDDDRSPQVIAISSVCIAILSIAFFLRLYSQNLITNPWKVWDTWLTVLASVSACIFHLLKLIDFKTL